jgi:uncharacterized protein involved in type VI secretion and phage assembly
VIASELLEPEREVGARWYGVYPAQVEKIDDPDKQGRVQVKLPWAEDADGAEYLAWARLATLLAGDKMGSWFIPSKGDEVLVCFEAGDPRRPYVIGSLWNGKDAAPAAVDGENNYDKVLCAKNGVKITLHDEKDKERLVLETPGGRKVTLSDDSKAITIEDKAGNSVKIEDSGITVNSAGELKLVASSTATIQGSTLKVEAGMSTFNGVIKCDTLIASSVIGSSYTPGAGNIW